MEVDKERAANHEWMAQAKSATREDWCASGTITSGGAGKEEERGDEDGGNPIVPVVSEEVLCWQRSRNKSVTQASNE